MTSWSNTTTQDRGKTCQLLTRINKVGVLGLGLLAMASSIWADEGGIRVTSSSGSGMRRRLHDERQEEEERPKSNFLMEKRDKKEANTARAQPPDGIRPTMYTYFEESPGSYASVGGRSLLTEWEASWHAAGWDTRILTLADAQSHPDFSAIDEVLEANGYREHCPASPKEGETCQRMTQYEKACIYRWFAMAATVPDDSEEDGHGFVGGWMSDFDTFPLTIQPREGWELPNGGEFTSFDGFVPDLMSGSRKEWDRVSHLLIEALPLFHGDYLSDMFLFQHLQSMYGDDAAHFSGNHVFGGWSVNSEGQIDCDLIANDGKKAAHFSHDALFRFSVQNGWFRDVTGKDEPSDDSERERNRGLMARRYIEVWKEKCQSAVSAER